MLCLLLQVFGDLVLFEFVFQNLFFNVLKYSCICEVVQVMVVVSEDGGVVCIIVIDNGVGFDFKYIDKLFGVF